MLRSLAAPLLWTAYIALPTRGWGWLDGVPIAPLEAAALALVWWVWAGRRRLAGTRAAAVLLVVKIAAGALLVDRGFDARYYANATWTAPVERSPQFRRDSFTRVDERLSFGGDRERDLPLYFLNDVRFNYYQPTEPRREGLPYSALWDGFLLVDEARRPDAFYVDADDAASGGLWIDGRLVVTVGRAAPRTGSVDLAPGWHALRLTVAAPQNAGRRFAAGDIVDEVSRPFDARHVYRRPVGATRLVVDAALGMASRALDAVLLLSLAALIVLSARECRLGRLLWLGAIVEALRYAAPYAGRVTVLGGGDDMLMYEHMARVIALGDPLLQAPGPGGGQGAPFYFQPLYPYFVALAHLVLGEDLFGVILVQRLLVAATVAWCAAITIGLFGARAGWVAIVAGGLFLYEKLGRWSYVLLAEPLFTPVLVGWTWLLIRLVIEPLSQPRLLAAGLVGGLATLIRSTLLLAWPVILPLWGASLRGRRARTVALLVVVMAAGVCTATLRNYIVTGRFVLVTTSFGINLSIGNQPSRPLAPPTPGRAAWYDRLQLDAGTRSVAEYAIQAPAGLATHLGRKAIYSVGLYDLSGLEVFTGTAWSYAGTWLLAIVGILRVQRIDVVQRGPVLWLPLALALCHFAAVVLIFPWGYGDRLIVPMYPLLIPYAAAALEPAAGWLEPHAVRGRAALASAAVRFRERAVPPVRWIAGGAAASAHERALAALRERRNWAYIAYAAAVTPWLSGEMWRAALIVPVVALVTARLTRSGQVHRIAAGLLWAAALGRVALAGSRSAEALHDPLFWGLAAIVALGAAAAARRRPAAAAALAATAGVCTMTATLLPLFPDFESAFPPLNADGSLRMLELAIGPAGVTCLLAIWIQAAATGSVRGATARLLLFAARGALGAALLFLLAGGLPGEIVDARVWFAVFAVLAGLVEGSVRAG